MRKIGAAAIVVGGLALASPAMAQTPTYVGVAAPAAGAVDAGAVLPSSGARNGAVLPSSGAQDGAVLSSSGARDGAVLASQTQLPTQVAATRGNTTGLAFTGADIAGLTMLGGFSIGVGVIVVRSSRRRSAESDSAGPLAAG